MIHHTLMLWKNLPAFGGPSVYKTFGRSYIKRLVVLTINSTAGAASGLRSYVGADPCVCPLRIVPPQADCYATKNPILEILSYREPQGIQ